MALPSLRDLASGTRGTSAHDDTSVGISRVSAEEAEHRAPRGREADRQLTAELLAQLRLLNATTTELAAHVAGSAINGVLEVGVVAFDAEGLITRNYHVAVGSVLLTNHAASQIVVQAGASTSTGVPTTGRGLQIIPAQFQTAVPIAAHAFTAYGTPGQLVSLQVFTGLQAYGVAR